MDYQEGFYHVISKLTGEKTIAQYEDGDWWMIGCGEELASNDFTVIGDLIEIPE